MKCFLSVMRAFIERSEVLKRLTIFLLLLTFLIIGCSSKAVKRQIVEVKAHPGQLHAQPVPLSPLEEKIDPRAFHFFVNATLYEQMGNAYLAALNYRKALQSYPDSYEIRFSLAENLYRLQKYEDGLAILAEINPKNANVYKLRAELHRARGAEDSARASYLELVTLDPENSKAYAYLASIYRKQGNLDSTIWAYENLLRIKPEQYRLWTELARLQAQSGDYEASKASFWNSIELSRNSENIRSYISLGQLYQALQQPESSLVVLKMALEIEPANVLIHRELRGLYISLDSLHLALPHAQKEVELTPLDHSAIRRLGMLYYWLDSLKQSDSIFTFLIESGDRHPSNHSYLGRIALRNDDLEQTCQQFTIATQLADSICEPWLDLGYVYNRMEQPDREIETYQKGLSHMRDEPSRLRLLFALGAAYERYGKYDEAVSTFEEIVAKNPNYDQALNYLGYMLADRGERLEYAHELIERAVSISPKNAAYLDSYGWVFYRLGNYKEALVHLERAVTLDSDPVIFDHLGDVYQAAGNIEQARNWWQKALEMDPDNKHIKEKLGL